MTKSHVVNPGARKLGRPGYDLDAVLLAAAQTFTERGYDGTSMDDLARVLGLSKSALYHHVAGKEQLLQLATDRALDGLTAVVEEAVAHDGPAVDRLELLVRRSVDVLVAELPFVTLLLRVRGNTATERRAIRRRREIDHTVAELVAKAVADGDLRSDVEPQLTARLLFGMVNSLVEWYRPTRSGSDAAELADAVCAIAFAGLRRS
jgi:AcrR family transcriptional regulator